MLLQEVRAKMRWLTLSLVAGALAMSPAEVAGQQVGSIRGIVRSAEGAPIPSAQVFVEGGGGGALTNADGRYVILNVPAGTITLVSSVIGYGTERREGLVVAGGDALNVDFSMRIQAMSLAEIVVTGVSEGTSRALVPFTVGRVGGEDIPVPPSNAVAALQGKVAGVSILQGSQPGSGVDILLRTPTSINRESSPLLVVDGVILGASSADISALDIESIEVVKGAAAASLYGSRAAAGVVQIRTRRGSSLPENRTRMTFRSEYGNSDIPRPIRWAVHHNFQTNDAGQYLNAAGQAVPRSLAATTALAFQDQTYPTPIYDNIGSLFNPGSYITNSASFGFNGSGTSWLATLANSQEDGVVRGNEGYGRTDFRLNLDHSLAEDVSLSVSAFHMRSERENLYGNVFFDFVQLSPDVNLLQPDPDGSPYIFQPDDAGIRPNPLYMLSTQTRTANRLRTMGSGNLRYNPLSWLAVDLNGSYDRSDRRTDVYIPKGAKTSEYPDGNPGFSSRQTGIDDALNASAGFSLNQSFGLLRTRTLFRGSLERNVGESFTASGDDMAVGGIPSLNALRIPSVSSSTTSVRTSSFLVNSDVNWDERYIFSGLVRQDGSSVFGPDERWHTYYRASGAYRMAAESWWPIQSVDEFKLRYSVGTAGGRPNFADQYEVFSILSGGGLSLSTLGNRYLKPEKSREQEFGVDIVALRRFNVQLTYATQTTRDQLLNVPLPSLFGFSSQWQNAGTIEGHTFEATLETQLIQRPGLSWSATLLGDRSRNRITEYDRPCHIQSMGFRCAGEQIGSMYTHKLLASSGDLFGHRNGLHSGSLDAFQINDDGLLVPVGVGNSWEEGVSKGLWGSNVVIDGVSYPWGMPVRLLNEDGTAALVETGNSNPTFRWGFSNQLQVGRLSLYGLLDSQVGGNIYNGTKQRMYQWQRHGDVDQHDKPEERKKPVSYYTGPLYNGNTNINWFIEDASYLKLRELSMRYRLDGTRFAPLQRIGLENLSLSLIGRNLLTWTRYSGYDPEIGSALNRTDSFDYPNYRTLTGSVEVTF